MGAGDIGEHFPDTDPQWKDADSTCFLSRIAEMLVSNGTTVSNVDVVVVAAEPALGPHKAAMAGRIASVLGLKADRVNVKAKRPEGFEETAEDVIAVFAVATLEE
jgi:2-C-methyl-D-erythritol 4-phosphate cytidylyltransferase/2-C-methyl-D-erythritol 2,4-cyclodiphosphate synthase